eukprot:s250_g35.t1
MVYHKVRFLSRSHLSAARRCSGKPMKADGYPTAIDRLRVNSTVPAKMARQLLLFTILQPCISVDPLQPPGGTFHWGAAQPAFSWGSPSAPAAQASQASQASGSVLLPNPPNPQAPQASQGSQSFWNSGAQGQHAQSVHNSFWNSGAQGQAQAHGQGQHAQSVHNSFWNSGAQGQQVHQVHASHTVGGRLAAR